MKRTLFAVAVMTALMSGGALAQATAPAPKAAPKAAPATPAATAAPAATSDKQLYSQGQYDVLLKERLAQGGQDSPEVRNAVKEELNTRELLAREAKKQGLEKNADVKTQMDLASQTVLVRAYVSDWIRKNPVPEADLKKEYEAIKGQIGDKEYKVRHILVEKEDEAKAVLAQLKAGAKFEDLAKKSSKDPGSAPNGGELDFAAPSSYVPEFSQAMVALKKGETTETPVKTQFGYHVIRLDDSRAAQFPPLADVKTQIQQRLSQQKAAAFRDELRAKAKTDYKFTN